ncbi:hypothetical protein KIN20_017909 [Parelaphostrongylus tenuis]|uniref:PP2A regulatory subunit B'' EF-hand domain-containing protein n=1 Tax=Parelaphostrongylus tenuis TaxID=148309 RepID=A0AAD5MIN6_PARTN|nr:hypothetical protein KIN20_017909 [Parelaphostrongylus tenuis]
MIKGIMHTLSSLEFCREAVELHDKYCDAVIARIMRNLGCVWKGKITPNYLRKSDLLAKIRKLQENVDINSCVRYFSNKVSFSTVFSRMLFKLIGMIP